MQYGVGLLLLFNFVLPASSQSTRIYRVTFTGFSAYVEYDNEPCFNDLGRLTQRTTATTAAQCIAFCQRLGAPTCVAAQLDDLNQCSTTDQNFFPDFWTECRNPLDAVQLFQLVCPSLRVTGFPFVGELAEFNGLYQLERVTENERVVYTHASSFSERTIKFSLVGLTEDHWTFFINDTPVVKDDLRNSDLDTLAPYDVPATTPWFSVDLRGLALQRHFLQIEPVDCPNIRQIGITPPPTFGVPTPSGTTRSPTARRTGSPTRATPPPTPAVAPGTEVPCQGNYRFEASCVRAAQLTPPPTSTPLTPRPTPRILPFARFNPEPTPPTPVTSTAADPAPASASPQYRFEGAFPDACTALASHGLSAFSLQLKQDQLCGVLNSVSQFTIFAPLSGFANGDLRFTTHVVPGLVTESDLVSGAIMQSLFDTFTINVIVLPVDESVGVSQLEDETVGVRQLYAAGTGLAARDGGRVFIGNAQLSEASFLHSSTAAREFIVHTLKSPIVPGMFPDFDSVPDEALLSTSVDTTGLLVESCVNRCGRTGAARAVPGAVARANFINNNNPRWFSDNRGYVNAVAAPLPRQFGRMRRGPVQAGPACSCDIDCLRARDCCSDVQICDLNLVTG